MPRRFSWLTFLFLYLFLCNITQAYTVNAYYFYSQGCIHCAEVEKYLISMERKYADLNLTKLEISHNKNNIELSRKFCTAYSLNCSLSIPTPIIFIGNRTISGDKPILSEFETEFLKCREFDCEDPLEKASASLASENIEPALSLIVVAALVDSINPCAFAVLIFLLTYLMAIGERSRMLKIGMVYICVIYVVYFVAGLGLLAFVQSLAISMLVYKFAAIVAIFGGIVNIKDFFFYGKWFSLEIPKSKKEVIEKYVHLATLPAVIALAILVAGFELPCTGGVYFAILAMLARGTFERAVAYLLIYSLFFVLPLIVILILFYQGYSGEKLESLRIEKRRLMRLIIGVVMIFLGAGMLLGWF
ncbi:MAG: hypothetical protein QXP42_04155 [Candidatus Micrarchaeia archaeon]